MLQLEELYSDKIENKIELLFSKHKEDKPDELRTFVGQIQEQARNADRSVRWHLFVFLLAWGLGYLIGSGIVVEGEIASFKIGDVRNLLIAWPPLMGGISYLILTSWTMSTLLISALSSAYEHYLPGAWRYKLDNIMVAPTPLSG